MSSIVIKNAKLLDPSEGVDMDGHLAVRDGIIAYVGPDEGQAVSEAGPDAAVVDARGRLVTPGLIDMHVHLREPGNEAGETIASGTMAAVAGGFTSVVAMPNTVPPVDDEAAVLFQLRVARRSGFANVFPVGAATAGRKGEELAEMSQMAKAGVVAFSDDGDAVPTSGLLRRALAYAKMTGRPILEHCEDSSLKGDGVMDEGFMSTVLGLRGIPDECEEIIVARDVAMARLTGGHVHIQHVSTANSVEIIRNAKREGIRVTAEAAPHHLTLTCDAVRGYDPVFKVNPPLRADQDIAALRRGLHDGTIDAIASDHAPHLEEAKELEFAQAPSGMIGLETTLGVVATRLIAEDDFTWADIIPALTSKPSDILGLDRGRLKAGLPGDVTIIDPEMTWIVDAEAFQSKSRNCPFNGWELKGRAVMTIVGGRVMFDLEKRSLTVGSF